MSDLFFRVGAESSEFDRAMKSVVQTGSKAAGDVVDKMGDKLFKMKEVGQTLATALGLNLESIAQNLARYYTGLSKDEEEAYKRSESLDEQATSLALQNMRARLDEQSKYKLALADRARLEQQVAELDATSGAGAEQRAKKRIELEQRISEIIAYEQKQRAEVDKDIDEQLKRRNAVVLEEQKAGLERLSVAERQKLLTGDIAALEVTISNLKRDGHSATLLENDLFEKQKLLQQANKDADTERLEKRRAIAASGAEELELLTLQQKVSAGMASGSEQLRLEQIRLQRKEREMTLEIERLEAKSIDGTLTEAERKRLMELVKQHDKLKEQLTIKAGLIEGAGAQAKAESAVTAELERQAAAARAAADAEQQRRQWQGTGSPLGLQNLGNISSDVLKSELKQLQDEMRAIEREYQQKGYTGNARQDNYYLASQMQSIQDELSFRDSFAAAYARGGRQGALSQYVAQGRDALSFDTAIANMATWSQGQDLTNQKLDATKKSLDSISSQLAKSGIFPKG